MSKGKLVFNLPEESFDHEVAIKGMKLYSLISDLDQQLRGYLKHQVPTLESSIKLIEDTRSQLQEALSWFE